MPYKINDTVLSLQPTTGRWISREKLGTNGTAHPIYSAVREFELSWELSDQTSVNQLFGMFQSFSTTGTCSVDLPKYNNPAWGFTQYSGCTLTEPEIDTYYEEHTQNVKMLIMNIRG